MNERIFELAKEAKIKFTHEFTHDPTEKLNRAFVECWKDELERFAELIVQECLMKVNGAKIRNESYSELISRIKEDFGVEE
jgi:hypothetical protein